MKKIFTNENVTVLVIGVSIGLIVGSIFLVTYILDKVSGNFKAKQNQKEIRSISLELTKETSSELKSVDYYSEVHIYDIMHRMANSKIEAKDGQIWGELPMDKAEIQALKKTIEKIDYWDRDYLLEVLDRWENGDFSKCVEEHNYLWHNLGGTVGEADDIRE